MKTLLSILIPTRDNVEDLIDCLESIGKLDYPPDRIEIVIWDNNSSQQSKGTLKSYLDEFKAQTDFKIEFIEFDDNYGVYTSRDELIKRVGSDSEYILSIDDDVILPDRLLKSLLPLFDQDQRVGIVGPRIVYDASPLETSHGAGFVNWWLGRYTIKDAKKAIECDYVIGCCMLIKKQVIDDIGGFDRDYYTSHGEVDFCLRAKKKGFKVIYDPSVVVRHRVEKGGTRSLERLYYVYRNKLLVIKKNWPFPKKWIAQFIYSILWFPKAFFGSLVVNKRLDYPEIVTITEAIIDGWLNRYGKKR